MCPRDIPLGISALLLPVPAITRPSLFAVFEDNPTKKMHPRISQFLDYDIDTHLNRVVPHSRVARLPKPISRFLGFRDEEYKEKQRLVVVFWSFLGSLLGLLTVGALYRYAPGLQKWHPPVMIASLVCGVALNE